MKNTSEYFNTGNYIDLLRYSVEDDYSGISRILNGDFENGLRINEKLKTENAMFFSAFAFWALEKKEECFEVLSEIEVKFGNNNKAAYFKRLISSKKINVLVQAREDKTVATNYIKAMKNSKYFDVLNLGLTDSFDVKMDFLEDINTISERFPKTWRPDFFLCHQMDHQPLPSGIENASFPTFCVPNDYDIFFHYCYHIMQAFDGIIALSSFDHRLLGKLYGKNVITWPLLFGVDAKKYKVEAVERDIDILITGSPFDSPIEKSRLVCRLAQLSEKYKVVILRGMISEDFYLYSLSRAKLTFTYVERHGAINSRAIEALSRGCAALYQEGGDLGLFVSEADGAIPYNIENLEIKAISFLENYDNSFRRRKDEVKYKVKSIFDIDTVMHRFLCFLTLSVSMMENRKKNLNHSGTQMRYSPMIGAGIPTAYGLSDELIKKSYSMCREKIINRDNTSYDLNVLGQLYYFEYLFDLWNGREKSVLFKEAVGFYEIAIQKFPANVFLLYSFSSFLMQCGREEEALKYLKIIFDIEKPEIDFFEPVPALMYSHPRTGYVPYSYALIEYCKEPSDCNIKKIKDILYSEIYFMVGKIEILLGNYDSAAFNLSRSVELHSFQHNNDLLGAVLYRLGRISESYEHFNRAFEFEPNRMDNEAITMFIDCCKKLEKNERAAEIIKCRVLIKKSLADRGELIETAKVCRN